MERYRAWTVEVCNDFHGPTRSFIGADRVPVCAICHRPTSRTEVVPASQLEGAVEALEAINERDRDGFPVRAAVEMAGIAGAALDQLGGHRRPMASTAPSRGEP